MTSEDKQEIANAIAKLIDTLTKLDLTPFGNVWEFELELYEWWIRNARTRCYTNKSIHANT